MIAALRFLIALGACILLPGVARADAVATLFRVFLVDGTSIVSYGELARVEGQVIFSMPVGGSFEDPRLHPVTLSAELVDWPRTDRYAVSARYQHYVATRAEADYARLTDEVAAVLNEVAFSSDRARALSLAEQARRTLAEWPRAHYGYRQDDVREIVGLIDSAIARLRGVPPRNAFELTLVATADPIDIEPLVSMPSSREQLDQIFRILSLTTSATERVALLQAARALLNDSRAAFGGIDVDPLRRSVERQLRREAEIDERYAKLTLKMLENATRAAGEARVADVERLLDRIRDEDARLGRQRPDVVQALTSSVQVQLDAARQLRLLRDQWTVRQTVFRRYERSIGSDLLQLVRAQPMLEAIRSLEGPPPERLSSLQKQLDGGAVRLERLHVPVYLRSAHELLVGAWRFAERAADGRSAAVLSGDLTVAWEASSAAAGALMMLSRAQEELRALLEPPKLQ